MLPQKSSHILANKDNALESQLNKTSLTSIPNQANLSEPQSEETNSNMARAYGKYQNVKDTPSHLYGTNYNNVISSITNQTFDLQISDIFYVSQIYFMIVIFTLTILGLDGALISSGK